MNVRCPSCRTVYRVDPDKVPTSGVRARCTVCAATLDVRRDMGRAPVFQVQLHAAEGMVVQHQIARAVGENQENPEPVASCADVGEQIDGRVVRPVDIVDEENDRPGTG